MSTPVSHPSSPHRPMVVRHLPLIVHAIDQIGIRDVVNELCPRDPRNRVSNGDCVAVMIANVLGGRVALYEMGEWLSQTDADLLLGEGTPCDAFHDDRLGRCLDLLFEAGTEFVFSEVARGVLSGLGVGTERAYTIHSDTTSLSLHGLYEEDPANPWPAGAPVPARGYSKDHRPDLKQLVFGLSVHGPTRIPMGFSVLDGNTADSWANRFQIESLAQLLPADDEVTLVGDCKLVDATTLGRARHSGFHYVSLLPHTFKLRRELVEEVRTSSTPLDLVGSYPGRTQASPDRVYQATSFVRSFLTRNPETEQLEAHPHRLVVVRSSTQASQFDGKIDRKLAKEDKRLTRALDTLAKREFSCEDDLAKEVQRATAKSTFHVIETKLEQVEVQRKRARRGRPRKDEPAPTELVWKLTSYKLIVDDERVDIERFHAAHFVLVTDHVDAEAWPDQRIFRTYRAQQSIEGHAGFRWLKNVADVAPVFLELPHRIQALALVFMLALMVRNWIESTTRARIQQTGELLPNFNDKLIETPTAENILYLFRAVIVLATVDDDQRIRRREVHFMNEEARTAMRLIDVPESIFRRPPPRKMGPLRGEITGM